jgi:hypothetical protein
LKEQPEHDWKIRQIRREEDDQCRYWNNNTPAPTLIDQYLTGRLRTKDFYNFLQSP